MRSLGSWLRWSRQRLAGLLAGRPAARAAAVAAGVLVLAGLGWLALSGGPRMVPVLDRQWTAPELAEAQKALSSRLIDHQVESGRLLVPRSRLAEARAVLHQEVLDAGGESGALEQLAQKEDIWSSQSQIAKRWQAAKMAAMARLIRRFPAVHSATVIFEDAPAGGLGAAAEPTASVGVELKAGCSMTTELVEAIADLVAGGVTGMKRPNVRVVDSSGHSYRAEDPTAGETAALRQLRAAESYFTRKVRSAIPRIEGTVVAVRVEPQEPPPAGAAALPRCAEVRVSIPRRHFVAAARAATGLNHPDDGAVESATAAGIEQVRGMVTAALGEKDAAWIKVGWHYDESPAAAEAPARQRAQAESSWGWWAGTAAAGAAIGVGLFAIAVRLFPRRKAGAAGSSAQATGARGPDFSGGVLGVLQWASAEDILTLVRGEHPQTVAVLLSALPAERAGSVLAALAPEVQREVSRRIIALERIEPQMLREVDRALADRLAAPGAALGQRPAGVAGSLAGQREQRAGAAPAPAAGGMAKLADLLHRAGHQTARTVLQSLSQDMPGLAESLRRRSMSFEDIATVGESRLAAVLEGMDSRLLAVALRTASKPLVQKVISCLSAPAARRLRGQMEKIGAVRLSDVESAQQQVVSELLVGEYVPAGTEQVV